MIGTLRIPPLPFDFAKMEEHGVTVPANIKATEVYREFCGLAARLRTTRLGRVARSKLDYQSEGSTQVQTTKKSKNGRHVWLRRGGAARSPWRRHDVRISRVGRRFSMAGSTSFGWMKASSHLALGWSPGRRPRRQRGLRRRQSGKVVRDAPHDGRTVPWAGRQARLKTRPQAGRWARNADFLRTNPF